MQRSSNGLLSLTIECHYKKVKTNKKVFKILRGYIPGIELNVSFSSRIVNSFDLDFIDI